MPDPSSLYPQPPAQTNGLLSGDPAKIIGLFGAINQNALFQQEFAAKKAIGQAYQDAITPGGGIDTDKLMNGPRGIKNNPDAGFLAGEASAGALARTHQQIANTAAAQDLAQKQTDYITNFIGSTATNPNARSSDVVNGLVALKRNVPTLPSDMINGFIKQFNGIDDSTPEGQLKLQAAKNLVRDWAMGPTSLATRVAGAPQPGTGAPTTAPLGVVNNAGAPAAAPASGVVVGNPPGFTEAATASGGASGSAVATARHEAVDYQRQIFPLEQAIPALERLGRTGTGPGTEELNNVKSFLQSAGIPGLDASKIRDFDEAKKYLVDFVNQNGNSGTNDKLAASFAGSPNVHMSNLAATDVAKAALALRRMKMAQLVDFEKSGEPDSNFLKYTSKHSLNNDPRVYAFDLMTPAQRRNVIDSFGKDQNKRELFMMAVQSAKSNGLIHAPGQ